MFLVAGNDQIGPAGNRCRKDRVIVGVGRQIDLRDFFHDNGARTDVGDDGGRFVVIDKPPQAGAGKDGGKLSDLHGGNHEFDLAAQPRLAKPVRRRPAGNEGADKDIGVNPK